MLRFLEGIIHRHPLHIAKLRFSAHGLGQIHPVFNQAAVRRNIQTPLAELVHLALLFAYHHRHLRLAHPGNLPLPILFFLFISGLSQFGRKRGNPFCPIAGNEVVHLYTGDFVDTHQHGFAGFPGLGIVLHEVSGHLLQPFVGGNDVIVMLELLLKSLGHINVAGFQLFQLCGNTLVKVSYRNTQLVAARVVIQRHGGFVFYRPLEVVR